MQKRSGERDRKPPSSPPAGAALVYRNGAAALAEIEATGEVIQNADGTTTALPPSLAAKKRELDQILPALTAILFEEIETVRNSYGGDLKLVQMLGPNYFEPVSMDMQAAHALDRNWQKQMTWDTTLVGGHYFANRVKASMDLLAVANRAAELMDALHEANNNDFAMFNRSRSTGRREYDNVEFVRKVIQAGANTGNKFFDNLLQAMTVKMLQLDPKLTPEKMVRIAQNSVGMAVTATGIHDKQMSPMFKALEIDQSDPAVLEQGVFNLHDGLNIHPNNLDYNANTETMSFRIPPKQLLFIGVDENKRPALIPKESENGEQNFLRIRDIGPLHQYIRSSTSDRPLTKNPLDKTAFPDSKCAGRLNPRGTGLSPVAQHWNDLVVLRQAYWKAALLPPGNPLPPAIQTLIGSGEVLSIVATEMPDFEVEITESLDGKFHISAEGNPDLLLSLTFNIQNLTTEPGSPAKEVRFSQAKIPRTSADSSIGAKLSIHTRAKLCIQMGEPFLVQVENVPKALVRGSARFQGLIPADGELSLFAKGPVTLKAGERSRVLVAATGLDANDAIEVKAMGRFRNRAVIGLVLDVSERRGVPSIRANTTPKIGYAFSIRQPIDKNGEVTKKMRNATGDSGIFWVSFKNIRPEIMDLLYENLPSANAGSMGLQLDSTLIAAVSGAKTPPGWLENAIPLLAPPTTELSGRSNTLTL